MDINSCSAPILCIKIRVESPNGDFVDYDEVNTLDELPKIMEQALRDYDIVTVIAFWG